jgi:hypothetical protein
MTKANPMPASPARRKPRTPGTPASASGGGVGAAVPAARTVIVTPLIHPVRFQAQLTAGLTGEVGVQHNQDEAGSPATFAGLARRRQVQ